MDYKTIEAYFLSEESVQELLESYSLQFSKVQDIADKLIGGQIMTKEEIDQSLAEKSVKKAAKILAKDDKALTELADDYLEAGEVPEEPEVPVKRKRGRPASKKKK